MHRLHAFTTRLSTRWGERASFLPAFNSSNQVSRFFSNDGSEKRRLDVAIVGAPNAGKSQFLNTVTNTTVAAVSRKRHTTRNGILATHSRGNAQLVFIDTPGFVQCKSKKDEGMIGDLIRGARAGMDRADYTLLIVDAAKKVDDQLREELAILMVAAQHARGRIEEFTVDSEGNLVEVLGDDNGTDLDTTPREKFAIVLNKVDLVNPKPKLLDIAEDIGLLGDSCVRYRGETLSNEGQLLNATEHRFSEEEEILFEEQYPPVFFISALKNDGIDDVLNHLYSRTTLTKDFVLPLGQKTAMSLAERVEELIREKLYRNLHREVPHSITQINRVLRKGRKKDGSIALRIDQDLVVKTKSHYKLVTGRGGMTLKRIHEAARRDLLKTLGVEGYDDVFLNLNVKLSRSKGHDRELEAERQGILKRVN